jgi:hypothetical protein
MPQSKTRKTAKAKTTPVETWAEKLERLAKRPPAEGSVTIPDPDAMLVIAQKRLDLQTARRTARHEAPTGSLSLEESEAFIRDHPAVQAAHGELDEAVEAARDAEITFTFRALPPHVYDGLAMLHPPTDEQVEADMTWNPDTYVPALVSACSVQPLSEDQFRALTTPRPDPDRPGEEIAPPLNQGDVAAMVQMCRDLNEQPRMMLGKGSRAMPG